MMPILLMSVFYLSFFLKKTRHSFLCCFCLFLLNFLFFFLFFSYLFILCPSFFFFSCFIFSFFFSFFFFFFSFSSRFPPTLKITSLGIDIFLLYSILNKEKKKA